MPLQRSLNPPYPSSSSPAPAANPDRPAQPGAASLLPVSPLCWMEIPRGCRSGKKHGENSNGREDRCVEASLGSAYRTCF